MNNYLHVLIRQMGRELLLNYREPRKLLYSCLFFSMILVFFPLTISADTNTLRMLAPGLIWIDMLLAFFLSSERLFQQDYDDGVLEQWFVSVYPISLMVTAKIVIHWILNVAPMILFCPILAIFLHLNAQETLILILSLICGTPAILFLCAFAAAFSIGLNQKGVLIALILFPLTIPVMIFGSNVLSAAMAGQPVGCFIALLAAFSALSVGFLPLATGAVVGCCGAD